MRLPVYVFGQVDTDASSGLMSAFSAALVHIMVKPRSEMNISITENNNLYNYQFCVIDDQSYLHSPKLLNVKMLL